MPHPVHVVMYMFGIDSSPFVLSLNQYLSVHELVI